MKVKVTKKMVNELNKALKDKPVEFDYRELDVDSYRFHVNSDYFQAYDWGDYDYNKSMFRYIAVIYPAEYFAFNKTLTTYDLNRIFRSGMTFDDFAKAVFAEVEV